LNPVAEPSCPQDTVVDGARASREDCAPPGDECADEPVIGVPADGGAGL